GPWCWMAHCGSPPSATGFMAGGGPANVTLPVIVPVAAGSSGVTLCDALHALSSRPQAARRQNARAKSARGMGATIGRAPYPVKSVGIRRSLAPGWSARYRGAARPRSRHASLEHRPAGVRRDLLPGVRRHLPRLRGARRALARAERRRPPAPARAALLGRGGVE